MKTNIVTFLIGVVMALGFGLAGITRPETIVGFLDFSGDWRPAVMLVMGTGVVVTFVAYRLIFRRQAPLLGPRFMVPTRRDVDWRLVTGAALFGVGWGVTGYCPGPALASVATGSLPVYVFLGTMVAGMLLYRGFDRALERARARRASSDNQQNAGGQPALAPRG
jgi:uncharacterized membrane protein YedE/YeeE